MTFIAALPCGSSDGLSIEPGRIQHDRHDSLGRIACLKQEQHRTRRDWCHQPLQKIHTPQRRVDDGGSICVGAGRPSSASGRERTDRGGVKVRSREIGADRALHLIAGDHLRYSRERSEDPRSGASRCSGVFDPSKNCRSTLHSRSCPLAPTKGRCWRKR